MLAGVEGRRRVGFERRQAGGKHTGLESGREAPRNDGHNPRCTERARRSGATRADPQALTSDQDVARSERRGETGIEIGE